MELLDMSLVPHYRLGPFISQELKHPLESEIFSESWLLSAVKPCKSQDRFVSSFCPGIYERQTWVSQVHFLLRASGSNSFRSWPLILCFWHLYPGQFSLSDMSLRNNSGVQRSRNVLLPASMEWEAALVRQFQGVKCRDAQLCSALSEHTKEQESQATLPLCDQLESEILQTNPSPLQNQISYRAYRI